MLEREHRPRAAEAGLHLVDAEERPVPAAQRLRAFEVAGRREMHALALHRLDDEERDVLAAQLGSSASRSPNGTRSKPGSSGPKRAVNSAAPLAESEPSVRPWKPWSAESTRVRFVAARPSLIAASTASVPLFVNRQRSSRGGVRASSASASSPGSAVTPIASMPGVSSSSASMSAARMRGLLRPTLYIPKPPSMSR